VPPSTGRFTPVSASQAITNRTARAIWSGRHAAHPHAVGRPRLGQRGHEHDLGRLGGAVAREGGRGHDAEHIGQGDDDAARRLVGAASGRAVDEALARRAGGHEETTRDHVERRLPVGRIDVLRGRRSERSAGGVDDHVEPAEGLGGVGNERGGRGRRDDVARNDRAAPAQGAHGRARRGRVADRRPRADRQVGAVRGEVERDHGPQAPRAADHEASRALESHVVTSLLARTRVHRAFRRHVRPV
jgi:hypothetical protein